MDAEKGEEHPRNRVNIEECATLDQGVDGEEDYSKGFDISEC